MSHEQNSARYRQLIEDVLNQRNPALMDQFIARDYHHHLAHFPTDEPGPDLAQEFLTAFPDLHVTIEDVVASDDAVAARGYWTGTFTHSLSGIPPTGKPVRVPYIDFWHVRDGTFVANWFQYDQRALVEHPATAAESVATEGEHQRAVGSS